jgi:adenine-specific DNA-methyltransferase
MARYNNIYEIISDALKAFDHCSLADAAGNLLAALGYKSDRTLDLGNSSPSTFLEFIRSHPNGSIFDENKALCSDWKSANLLFQLTDEELSGQDSLFKEISVNSGLLRSYVFFTIELTGQNHAVGGKYIRSKLTGIARQINRIFPMPVMVLIKHYTDKQPVLSIAIINRRQNKRDITKDVLGKVTIIQDISLLKPHRGHLDILCSLSVSKLVHPEKIEINSFETLHVAWEEIFNVELLNQRFYRELANWYFWALPQIYFPSDTQQDDEKLRATSLIRLLTRLIFCWFLKEKGLITENLFVEHELVKVLSDLNPDSDTYYQGILQNLFFATLNQRMGKDKKNGQPYRRFVSSKDFHEKSKEYGVTTLFRYPEHFRDPQQALLMFSDIPFLNGGLFECLDYEDPENNNRMVRVDGFTTNGERSTVPNRLFFAREQTADLSSAYGEARRKNERVRGLLHILHSYKFTIVENTPIDQEIALDPELLGKVFENLLASYNEETKATARKQTGSFYTPRPIVEYIVDESLKAHLTAVLVNIGMKEIDAQVGLDILFAYTERDHSFKEREVDALLEAIHTVKILDPACGSGAFPMGMLQKLVYIIHKLDPNNAKWKQLQIDVAAKIPDPSIRDAAIVAIERDFADNDDDYGRKLYLIENCLYGVDIQPIAIQISKLRFFISLICNQRTNRIKRENHGIRPLPNLETKFVSADTLISLPEIVHEDMFVPLKVYEIESEIESLYHRHFSIQRRDQKFILQSRIKNLRHELGKILAQSLMTPIKAQHVANWDAFDPQASADFFDPHWMFGRSLAEGFDIIFGNPPYQSGIDHKKTRGEEYRAAVKERYKTTSGTWDLYIPFFEAGIRYLKTNGVLSFISPNKFLSATYGAGLRKFLLETCRILALTDVSHLPVFESASVYPVISTFQKGRPLIKYDLLLNLPVSRAAQFNKDEYQIIQQKSNSLTLLPDNIWGFLLSPRVSILEFLLKNCQKLDDVTRICATTTASEADELGATLCSEPSPGWKTLNTGTIDPFCNFWSTEPIRHQGKVIQKPIIPVGPKVSMNRRDLYSSPKLIFAKMALRLEGFVDRRGEYAALNCNCASNPKSGWTLDSLAVVLHSSVVAFAYKQYFDALRMSGGYLPFQAPQLKMIPVPKISKSVVQILDTLGQFRELVEKQPIDKSLRGFLIDICDACVMECYFKEHMMDRDLLILDELAPYIAGYDQCADEDEQVIFLKRIYSIINTPSSKIRNRLLRLAADSPELLAVIKDEGRG